MIKVPAWHTATTIHNTITRPPFHLNILLLNKTTDSLHIPLQVAGHSTGTRVLNATTTLSKPLGAPNGSHQQINTISHRNRLHHRMIIEILGTTREAMGLESTIGNHI